MMAKRKRGVRGIEYKEVLVRLPVELVEILDERVLEMRGQGLPASRTFLLQRAVLEYATLGCVDAEPSKQTEMWR
jgi:hypothetical protein